MATPTFEVTQIDEFSHPTDEMPEAIKAMFDAGAFIVFRYLTDDGRIAWVPVSDEARKGIENIEAHVEKLAMASLEKLDD